MKSKRHPKNFKFILFFLILVIILFFIQFIQHENKEKLTKKVIYISILKNKYQADFLDQSYIYQINNELNNIVIKADIITGINYNDYIFQILKSCAKNNDLIILLENISKDRLNLVNELYPDNQIIKIDYSDYFELKDELIKNFINMEDKIL